MFKRRSIPIRPLTALNLRSLDPRRSIREQFAADNLSEITNSTTLNELPRIEIGPDYYIKEDYLYRKRPKTS
jgi:hypothetical protein